MTKVGEPGYGVEGEKPQSPPPSPRRNSPDWDRYLHPDRLKIWKPRRRPPEQPDSVTPPETGVTDDQEIRKNEDE